MGEKFTVEVAADQFDKFARVTMPLAGVEQLIWNSLDAEAHTVTVALDLAGLGAVEEVIVVDDGHGMTYGEAREGFAELGNSWKKDRKLTKNDKRTLRGRDGEGRFRAFSLGRSVTWTSFAENDDGSVSKVTVAGSVDDGRFEISLEDASASIETGTTVHTEFPREYVRQLLAPDAPTRLVTRLASFLARYPDVVVVYNGHRLTVESILLNSDRFVLDGPVGAHGQPVLEVMEWDAKVTPSIILCDGDGVALHEVTDDVPRAPNVHFTAYLHWDGFGEYQSELLLGDTGHLVLQPILNASRAALDGYLAAKRDAERAALIQKWRADDVYPFKGPPATPMQAAERRVFDAVAVTASGSLKGDKKSTKLSLRLIKEALEQDPGALHDVLKEVLDLSQEQVEDFANILKRTPLSAVISTTRTVTDRLEFLDQLQSMLFDTDKRPHLLERTQLHRTLASRTWVFGETYSLAVSDKGLTKVLEKHRELMGEEIVIDGPVKDEEGRTRIVDLMLSRALKEGGGRRHLVVELKRPTVKLRRDEVEQVINYAEAVAADERFGTEVEWDFVLIGNAMDDRVRRDVTQKGREKGLRSAPGDSNYRVWVVEWSDVLEENRQRLHFFEQQLKFEPGDDECLEATLNKLLPADAERLPEAG